MVKERAKAQPLSSVPWHVPAIAVFSVLALLANNIDQIDPASALPPIGQSIAGAGLLLLLAWLWLRSWQRAALVASILLVLFFSYGHVYTFLKAVTISGFYPFRHRTLGVLWIAMAGLGVWWASRRRPEISRLTQALNVVSLALLILPVFQIGSGLWRHWRAWERSQAEAGAAAAPGESLAGKAAPDIYYIILDGYSRADILEKLSGYDNSAFLASLEQMGFYVARCSQSNYAQTELSLASTLNYDYLEALGDSFGPDSPDRSPLWPLIRNGAVRRTLEGRGYTVIAFRTGFDWTEWTDADLFLGPQLSPWQLDAFQYLWLQTTAARILLDAEALRMVQRPEDLSRNRTAYDLQELVKIPSMPGPKFVFAHLIIPHVPYVFGPNGEPVLIPSDAPRDQAMQGYVNQVIYINKKMLEILPAIIRDSPVPPVIIVQGDHGIGGSPERMANLSAVYLPGQDGRLYPEMTNVNTFRVVLSEVFGDDLPILKDVSLFSDYYHPYRFHEVQNDCAP
ncbi:MAG TPA: hypothetical protein VLD63_12165 [Anaerolineales bacterium]|nr:hypothetical protein [Anaerolineales bacterium]